MEQIMIGRFLKQMRTEKGFTQKALADKLGISDKTVSKWENGRGLPEPSLMLPLCEILEITVNEMLSAQRLAPNDYSRKAEENMMNLVKQNEKNKHKGGGNIFFGIIMIASAIILIMFALMCFTQNNSVHIFCYFIDIPTLIMFLFIDGVLLAATGHIKDFFKAFFPSKINESFGYESSAQAIKLILAGNIYVCCFIFVFEMVQVINLCLSDNFGVLGPSLAVAILSIFYMGIINLILQIPLYKIKKLKIIFDKKTELKNNEN